MKNKFKKITFKPLKNGKYKCNQTGRIVKRGNLKAYKRSLENEMKN